MKRLRILLATGLYPPQIGGPATYARMLEEKLPLHGIEVSVIPFSRVHTKPKLIRHIQYVLLLLKESKHADVIYALDSISVGWPALIVSFLTRKRLLLRLGGDYAWEQGQQRFGVRATLDEYTQHPQKAPLPVRLLAFLQRIVATSAYKVIAPSGYLKRIISSWGVNPSKIHVIYSALSPLGVESSKASLRETLGLRGKVLTTAGRLVPWKGFGELIDAVAVLKQHFSNISLYIIGEGPLYEELSRKITQRGLSNTVHLLGKKDKQELGRLIKASDVFVLNTSYEGLSHQLLEAMDLGTPVVATSIGGNPELITNEVSGLLVPIADNEALKEAIRRLLENEQLGLRLSQSARVRTHDFREEKVIAELVLLLQKDL